MSYTPSLSNFLVVVEYMNISKAAEHLHMSQQALSAYIKRLEQHYDRELFVRKPTLALTPEGRHVLKAAKRIEEIHRQLEQGFINHPKKRSVVNMGFMRPRVGQFSQYLPMVQYRNQYPQVSLRVVEESVDRLEEMTISNKLDFFVGDGEVLRDGLVSCHLFYEDNCLVITDALLKEYFSCDYLNQVNFFEDGVDFEEFLDVPQFVFPERIPTARRIKRFYSEYGLVPNIAGENPNLDLNMQMAVHGVGFTVCPERSLERVRKQCIDQGIEEFHSFKVKRPDLRSSISIVSREGEEYPEHVIRLMEMIQEAIR